MSEHKAVLALLITAGTVALLSGFYIFWQGRFEFWCVDDIWNIYTDKSMLYKWVLPVCFVGTTIVCFFEMRDLRLRFKYKGVLYKSMIKKQTLFKRETGGDIESKKECLNKQSNIVEKDPKCWKIKKQKKFLILVSMISLSLLLEMISSTILEIAHTIIKLDTRFWTYIFPNMIIIISLICVVLSRPPIIKLILSLNMIIRILFFASLGVVIFNYGELSAMYQMEFRIIVLTENLPALPNEQLQVVDMFCSTTTTVSTSTTTIGTTTAADTALTAFTTSECTTTTVTTDMPSEMPVYVILTENKDNYLAVVGVLRQGGRLDYDRNCQIVLEKNNQIVRKQKFTEVNAYYTYPKEVHP